MRSRVLDVHTTERVLKLTLDRPEKRNALNGELVSALTEALQDGAGDDQVRVVAIQGAGRDFCAGADLAELERTLDMDHEAGVADAMNLGNLFIQMRRHPKPIVAVVHGRALAGGCGLATACDLVLARDDAEFGYPEVHLGFVPAMVMAILRRKVTEAVAFELATTGERISAQRARDIGLINRVFASDAFDAGVARLLETLADKPASALGLSKGLLYELDGAGFEEAIARGAEVNAAARRTEELREGIRRFLDRKDG